MMGLYQFKEFLSLDDVAEYLKDKGVYDFDLSCSSDQNKLKDWLIEQVRNSRIRAAIYYSTVVYAEATAYNIFQDKYKDEHNTFFDGYMGFDSLFYSEILDNNGEIKLETTTIEKTLYDGKLSTTELYICPSFYIIKDRLGSFDEFLKRNTNRSIKYYILSLPKWESVAFSNIIYPKSDLDALFNAKENSQQIADLQAENENLKTPIAELESELKQAKDDEIAKLQTQLKAKDERIAELERQLNERSTPANRYTTQAINTLNHVVSEFWENWKQGTTPPKQAHIISWILDTYPHINPTTAGRIERIARHESAK